MKQILPTRFSPAELGTTVGHIAPSGNFIELCWQLPSLSHSVLGAQVRIQICLQVGLRQSQTAQLIKNIALNTSNPPVDHDAGYKDEEESQGESEDDAIHLKSFKV